MPRNWRQDLRRRVLRPAVDLGQGEQPDRNLAHRLRLPGQPGRRLLLAGQQRRGQTTSRPTSATTTATSRAPSHPPATARWTIIAKPSASSDLRLRLHLGDDHHPADLRPDLRLLRDARRAAARRGHLAGVLADPGRRLLAAGTGRHGDADRDPNADWTTAHSGARNRPTESSPSSPDTADGFHTYGALWTLTRPRLVRGRRRRCSRRPRRPT